MSNLEIWVVVITVLIWLAWSARELERFITKRVAEEVADQLDDARCQREEAELAKKRRAEQKDWTPADWMKAGREERRLGIRMDEWPVELLQKIRNPLP